MASEINLTAIYIAHTMAITLMALMFFGNKWVLDNKGRDGSILKSMIILTVFSCLVDAFIFNADNKSGMLYHMIIYWGNFWQYLANLLVSTQWVVLFIIHIDGKSKKGQKIFLVTCFIVGVIFLIANLFTPVIYSVSPDNVYSRGPYYYIFGIIDAALILYSAIYYAIVKITGGHLKFFPVVQFVTSITIGIVIQNSFYGVSTIWPFIAIAICAVINSLQNEAVYHDTLTGVFNRAYLEAIAQDIGKRKNKHITAMMLDMDDFKSINDNYGHSSGDQALIDVSGVLTEVIGNRGSVIRYAGDEFIILINTSSSTESEGFAGKIKSAINHFNETNNRAYTLSLSIGYSFINFSDYTVDQLLEEIDNKMYLEKKTKK